MAVASRERGVVLGGGGEVEGERGEEGEAEAVPLLPPPPRLLLRASSVFWRREGVGRGRGSVSRGWRCRGGDEEEAAASFGKREVEDTGAGELALDAAKGTGGMGKGEVGERGREDGPVGRLPSSPPGGEPSASHVVVVVVVVVEVVAYGSRNSSTHGNGSPSNALESGAGKPERKKDAAP